MILDMLGDWVLHDNFEFNALKFGNEEHDAFIKSNKPENKFSKAQLEKGK